MTKDSQQNTKELSLFLAGRKGDFEKMCPRTSCLFLHFSLNSLVDGQLGQDQKYAINAITASITSELGRQRMYPQEGERA